MADARQTTANGLRGRAATRASSDPEDAWFGSVLRGAQAGSGWAFEQLWRRYAGRVLGYLRGQGAEDPEGLTNETFLGVFRALPRFEGDEAAFRSWLFSIAHRRLVDERRRRGRRLRTVVAAPHDGRIATDGGIDEALESLTESRVERLVAALPRVERDVLLLRVVAGLSAAEVGRLVGRRPGTVRMIQHRAVRGLRERLEHDV